jgi:precorrin-2 dehydrogenase/sirohydrochlorin ferrochelatase
VLEARQRGILVNRADDNENLPGDFTVPARFADGPATFTVAAGSPALSAMIRDELAKQWNPAWTQLADAMTDWRPIIRDELKLSPETRRRIFRSLATREAVDAASHGRASLAGFLRGEHPELAKIRFPVVET